MAVTAAYAVPHPPIIMPEIGHGEEKKIHATAKAYTEVMRQLAAQRPDTIVITSPHSIMYADYFHISPGKIATGDFSPFRAPQVSFTVGYDEAFAKALTQNAVINHLPAGFLGERNKELDHGTMIPLYFLKPFMTDHEYKIVRIGLSGLSPLAHYQLGQCIAKTAEQLDRRTVIIASGDLSHKLKADGPYGFASEGPLFDKQITESFKRGDFLSLLDIDPELAEAAAECGWRSFMIMAGALDCQAVTSTLYSYEGPFGVGYAVASFTVAGPDDQRNFGERYRELSKKRSLERWQKADPYVRLARLSLETYIRTGQQLPLPEDLPDEMMTRQAGVFVSLKKHGKLRGCIGTINPTTSCIAAEIIQNAVSAAVSDPRFAPITKEELSELICSVDVLGPAEAIASPDQLDIHRYGVIVTSGRRRGLLLPDLEGVNSVTEQIDIAKRKAGIEPGEEVRLQRFEVVRHL